MRFRDLDGMARLTLGGSAAAVLGFFLPWFTVRLSLQVADLSGISLAAAPSVLGRIGISVGWPGFLLAAAALLALVCALATFLLILAPAVSTLRELNARAGQRFAALGLAAALVAMLVMLVAVGPQLGATSLSYGALLAIVGLGLAAYAWPRARRLGDDEEPHEPAPTPGSAS